MEYKKLIGSAGGGIKKKYKCPWCRKTVNFWPDVFAGDCPKCGKGHLLKELIERGEVSLECPHCGTAITSWVTIMRDKCHKCDKTLGSDLLEQANQLQRQSEALRRYGFVRNILISDRGCVYYIGALDNHITVGKGEDAWKCFVESIMDRNFTNLKCWRCGYFHIVGVIRGDINFVPNLFDLRRDIGECSANNWISSFRCLSCETMNENVRVSVSMDLVAGAGFVSGKRITDPFNIGYFHSFLIQLSNIFRRAN